MAALLQFLAGTPAHLVGLSLGANVALGWAAHPLFASTHSYPAAWPALLRMLARYSGWHWQHTNPMIPLTAVAGQLGRVKAPTLVVSGGQDVGGYREIAEVLAAGIPGAGKLDLPEVGHMLTLEVPDRFNAGVRAFWAGCEGRSTPSAAVSSTKQERGGAVDHR